MIRVLDQLEFMEGLFGEAKGRGGWEVGVRFNRKVELGISGNGY